MEPTAQQIIELVTNIQVQQLSNVVIKLWLKDQHKPFGKIRLKIRSAIYRKQ